MNNLDTKFSNEIASVRVEMGELSASITNNSEAAEQNTNQIVRHLGSFGLVATGSTFDIPQVLTSIHSMLSVDVVPVFRAGLVESCERQEPVVIDPSHTSSMGEPTNVLGECMANVGMTSTALDGSSVEMSVDSVLTAPEVRGTMMPAQQDFVMLDQSHGRVQTPFPIGPGPGAFQKYGAAPPLFSSGNGLLPMPDALHEMRNHYMGVQTPQHDGSGGAIQASLAMHAPVKEFAHRMGITPGQQTKSGVGHSSQEGQVTATGAARTLFQNYGRIVTRPGAGLDYHVSAGLTTGMGVSNAAVPRQHVHERTVDSDLGHVVNITGPTPPANGVIVPPTRFWHVNKGNSTGFQ